MERKSPMITGISAGDARSRIFKAIQPTVSTKAHTIDTASVDLVLTMTKAGLVHNHDLEERMTTRHGFRQLECMHEMGMGNWRYQLLDLDNGEAEVSLSDAVAHVVPFEG